MEIFETEISEDRKDACEVDVCLDFSREDLANLIPKFQDYYREGEWVLPRCDYNPEHWIVLGKFLYLKGFKRVEPLGDGFTFTLFRAGASQYQSDKSEDDWVDEDYFIDIPDEWFSAKDMKRFEKAVKDCVLLAEAD